ncbi:hypothetical protein SCHIN_v1c03730 [Spiroplasma chinense]|uniref:Uncharacterized protein n=1 Tax=Spiroplasma chinense TaxID=216932 RepID=A0A5B9Y3P7_9MOLU|nr:hypothetical protein [Spiroplasma chinense]QEH61570.1 hypothetical protein SCHIN_v1c03730 [Spiroplasma chinense]
MISDVENGIYSLEVRRGLDAKLITWIKLLVSKSVLWFIVLFGMLSFYLIVIISKPYSEEMFLKGFIPGYFALIVLDIFFTGLCFFVASFGKIKLMTSIASFLTGILAISPALSILHLAIIYDDSIYADYRYINGLEMQKLAKSKPDGLTHLLFEGFADFNNNKTLEVFKKEDKGEDEGFERTQNSLLEDFDNKSGGLWEIIYYYITLGQILDIDVLLNRNAALNSYLEFKYKKDSEISKLHSFFEITNLKSDKSYFDKSVFKKLKKDNIVGKNQLNDYSKFITSKEVISNLEQKLSLQNLGVEIKEINKLIYKEISNFGILIETEKMGSLNKIKFSLNGNAQSDVGYSGVRSYEFGEFSTNPIDIYDALKVKDGNQLWMMFLIYLIGAASKGRVAQGEWPGFYKWSDVMEDDIWRLRKLFLVNPFMSIPFMSLFTLRSNDLTLNNGLMKVLIHNLYIQDVIPKVNENYEPEINYIRKAYYNISKSPIIDYEVTDVVLRSDVYYISYLFFGLSFLLIGHFIHIRKVKP